MSQRYVNKVKSITRRYLHGLGSDYLREYHIPVSIVSGSVHLRPADRGDLMISRARTVRAGGRSYGASDPTVWNSLPTSTRSTDITDSKFAADLKAHHIYVAALVV